MDSRYESPQAWYDATIGRSIDVDNFPIPRKYQCFDYFADFCIGKDMKVNLHCSITGYAGDLYKLRYEKNYDKYFEFFYPKNAKRGDWIFWEQHVAMVWKTDGDRVQCLGQNQGGEQKVTLRWYTLSTALGCMRWKGWIMINGWKKESGGWRYYLDGKYVKWWQKLSWSKGENWFYFNSDGIMQTGWKKLKWSSGTKEDWFYFDENGCMLTGFQELPWDGNKYWYLLDKSTGAMRKGTFTMELKFNSSGRLVGGKRV